MSSPIRLSARAWMLVPLCAFGFLVWANYARVLRVEHVTNTDKVDAQMDAASPTGYAGGKRWLIVPEHNNRSYQWIAETQQMLAMGEWRVRHVDYENAPAGREVHSASPYRWWLGLVAWGDRYVSGRPPGLAVERAALWAGPLLHLLLLAGATIYVVRQFGSFPAALLALGLATIYPFAGGFLPGVPDDNGMALTLALWSILPLLAGARSSIRQAAIDEARANRRMHQHFLVAGVAGGLGLWVSASSQTPVLVGIALGGILASWIKPDAGKDNPSDISEITPWRTWALGGATTSLAAYLIEYFPAHMDFRLQVNHPFYGLAWIGAGELLVLTGSWIKPGKSFWNRRQAIILVLATAAIAMLPVAMARNGALSIFLGDPSASRLSWLPNGVVAKSLGTWIARDGLGGAVSATCLPLLLLGPAMWLLMRRQTGGAPRIAVALALGPVVISLVLACLQLRWWGLCDVGLLALMVAVVAADIGRNRWLWAGFAGLIASPGLIQLWPLSVTGRNIEFTRLEAEGLVERTLAHWIADRADPGGAVILVPPDRTTSWCFHGGLRGLGTANWENRDGLAATVRIVTATTADEAQALINQRGVTHIILPSWDSDLDEFARWTLPNPEDGFIMALHHWALPPWLRPLPYNLPTGAGFDGQSVVILEVTDESNRAAALGRLAEYFIETRQIDLAASTVPSLQRFPTDLGVLVALAQVERARGNSEGFTRSFAALLTSLNSGFDRTLAWDRRVSLAVVLAQGERNDLAREQVGRCLEKLDEKRIRSLTTGSLFRLQVLGKAFGLQITDARLRDLARKLLPVELRERL